MTYGIKNGKLVIIEKSDRKLYVKSIDINSQKIVTNE